MRKPFFFCLPDDKYAWQATKGASGLFGASIGDKHRQVPTKKTPRRLTLPRTVRQRTVKIDC